MDLAQIVLNSSCSAAIFDLDGVVTDTAQLHAMAWKRAFDDWDTFCQSLDEDRSKFVLFDAIKDYDNFMAGRTRFEGVRVLLASRGIELPVEDQGGARFLSIQGIGNYKNSIYLKSLMKAEIHVYRDAVAFIEYLHRIGIKIGLATSSKNAPLIMEKTGLASLFDVIVDGNDVESLVLQSKPEPDIFIHTAAQLGFSIQQCAIFEDSHEALVSVRAVGAACVIGVDMEGGDLSRFGDMTAITRFDFGESD